MYPGPLSLFPLFITLTVISDPLDFHLGPHHPQVSGPDNLKACLWLSRYLCARQVHSHFSQCYAHECLQARHMLGCPELDPRRAFKLSISNQCRWQPSHLRFSCFLWTWPSMACKAFTSQVQILWHSKSWSSPSTSLVSINTPCLFTYSILPYQTQPSNDCVIYVLSRTYPQFFDIWPPHGLT